MVCASRIGERKPFDRGARSGQRDRDRLNLRGGRFASKGRMGPASSSRNHGRASRLMAASTRWR